MFAHKVKVESPLEVSARGKNATSLTSCNISAVIAFSGKEMIKTYLIPDKFKEWKRNRYKE